MKIIKLMLILGQDRLSKGQICPAVWGKGLGLVMWKRRILTNHVIETICFTNNKQYLGAHTTMKKNITFSIAPTMY